MAAPCRPSDREQSGNTTDGDDGRNRTLHREPGDPPAHRSCRLRAIGVMRGVARPEQQRPQRCEAGGNEHHRDRARDEHAEREPGPEVVEEGEVRHGERRRPGRHGDDGGHDHRRRRGDRVERGVVLRRSLAEAAPEHVEIEDRVVGDHAHEEHHDERLHLGRYQQAKMPGRQRQEAVDKHVGDAGGAYRNERRDGRAERAGHDDQHDRDARDLDSRQRTGDGAGLRGPCGNGTGRTGHVAAELPRIPIRPVEALLETAARVEDVRDRRRPGFA